MDDDEEYTAEYMEAERDFYKVLIKWVDYKIMLSTLEAIKTLLMRKEHGNHREEILDAIISDYIYDNNIEDKKKSTTEDILERAKDFLYGEESSSVDPRTWDSANDLQWTKEQLDKVLMIKTKGRPKRNTTIQEDEITDLKIALNLASDAIEFIRTLK